MKQDNAFTGLEAAIVLIAFVVVAAIFSYVLLGAGFFATQKAQEVTYAGIKQAVSNAVIDGTLYANSSENMLDGFMFQVRIPLGGEAIDMNTTTFLFASENSPIPRKVNLTPIMGKSNRDGSDFKYPDESYTINGYYPTPGIEVLTSGDVATFLMRIDTSANGCAECLISGEWFTFEMRPRIGAASLITKTLGSVPKTGDIL